MSGRPPTEDLLRRYHEPGQTPREEMWQAIVARIRSDAAAPAPGLTSEAPDEAPDEAPADDAPVRPIGQARRKLAPAAPWLRWAAAASVVLLIGIALGRSTAPDVPAAPDAPVEAARGTGAGAPPARPGVDVAVRRHLGRTESLLTVVRSDGRQGRIDPAAAAWAQGLLTQTRLLLDARADADPALVALLQDLELVLAEIVVVAEVGSLDSPRAQTELDLVLRALEQGSVLPRLQAACPHGCTTPAV